MFKRTLVRSALAVLLIVTGASMLMATGNSESDKAAEEVKEFSALIPWRNGNDLPPDENWNTIEYEKRTGIHVNWQVVPVDGWKEKRGVIIASGDLPDAIAATRMFGDSHFSDSELLQYGSQGIFVGLNQYIENNTVYLKAILEENPVLESYIKSIDGNLYAFPSFSRCFHCDYSQKAWINTDWLEALDLSMPTTTDELREVLMAFKTQDPNGNGLSDEVPISSSVDGWRTSLDGFMMTPFLYTDGDMRVFFDKNDQINYSPAQSEYRDGLKYIAGLYEDGLIAPETFTQDAGALGQGNMKGDEPVVGLGFGGVNFLVLGDTSSKWNQYDVLPPITGPSGFKTSAFYGASGGPQTGSFVITSAAKDPGMIVEWIDWLFSSEADLFTSYGPEGVGWRKAESGEKNILGGQATFAEILSGTEVGDQNLAWQGHIPSGSPSTNLKETVAVRWSDWREAPDFGSALETMLYQGSQPYAAIAPKAADVVPPFAVLPEDVTDFTLLQTTITDYVKESFARFVTGQLSIDNDWDQYIRRLDQLGLPQYLEIVQKGYDAKYGM